MRHVPGGRIRPAGFAVGAVEESLILTGQSVKPGDVVLGLASAGVHSMFQPGAQVIERTGDAPPATLDGKPFAKP